MQLIDTIEDELLKSPELTGEWESKLRKIESGEYEANQFKEELIQMVTELTEKVVYGKGKVITLYEEKEEVKEKKNANLPSKKNFNPGKKPNVQNVRNTI